MRWSAPDEFKFLMHRQRILARSWYGPLSVQQLGVMLIAVRARRRGGGGLYTITIYLLID
jgi:hypothetical protein